MRIKQVLILAGTLIIAAPVMADDNEESEMSRCASISDTDKRLACYDKLAPKPTTDEPVAPITADYGAEQLETDDENRKTAEPVMATITSCPKSASGKYLLYLDNGQVWKQKNNERLRLKKCNFRAELMRDGFGYKMEIEGGAWRMRVTRVR